MTNLKSLLIATATLSLPAATTVTTGVVPAAVPADFTNSFDGITAGSDVTLTWPASSSSITQDTKTALLCVTAQVIDRGEDEGSNKANVYKANVTTTATGNEYTWSGVPYPLRRIKNGLYQVEVRDCSSGAGTQQQAPGTVLVKSAFFSVEEKAAVVSSPPDTSTTTSPGGEEKKKSSGPPAINKTALGIGLGVAIGVPSIAGLAVVGWCFRKRQRRAAEERRWQRRREFVIY
ncbi:hypothetical protein QBC43DRAFT_82260 [Cladorrhinum sp. PSN259]|nr:hypothetical protein QBC43DRAFT_82260 [Cladorrhinum sp. PSN259]